MMEGYWQAWVPTNTPQPNYFAYATNIPPNTQLFRQHFTGCSPWAVSKRYGHSPQEATRLALGQLYLTMRACILKPWSDGTRYHWPDSVELVWEGDTFYRKVPMEKVREWWEEGKLANEDG